MKAFQRLLCKVFGHKIDDAELFVEQVKVTTRAGKPPTSVVGWERAYTRHLYKYILDKQIILWYVVNMAKRWTTSNKCVYNIGYHLIWCPKYRRAVLVAGVDTRLKELLQEKAEEIEVTILSMEVMPEHVHLFVKASPVDSPHFIVQQLKGYTSRILRKEFSTLKSRLPTLWTRSYYCESVGHISEETIQKYIDDQKNK